MEFGLLVMFGWLIFLWVKIRGEQIKDEFNIAIYRLKELGFEIEGEEGYYPWNRSTYKISGDENRVWDIVYSKVGVIRFWNQLKESNRLE